jgi:hypothetical protein
VCLYYGLGDREAQTGAFLLARPGFVYAVEALEDVWQVLFGNAGTAVFDPDKQLTGLGGCGEGYAPPGLLLTEWDEFGTLDLARVAATMNIPMLLDGRNAIAPASAREAGFHYVGVGRGESLVYHLRNPGERRPGSANSPSREGSDA